MENRKQVSPSQFEYLGRWVDKHNFRANVYNGKEKKLAKSYEEFIDLISSGLWFETLSYAETHLKTEKKNKFKSQMRQSTS